MLNEKTSRLLIELSQDKLKELGWKQGEDLEMDVQSEKLVLKPKKVR